jgi:hypothetical protein
MNQSISKLFNNAEVLEQAFLYAKFDSYISLSQVPEMILKNSTLLSRLFYVNIRSRLYFFNMHLERNKQRMER